MPKKTIHTDQAPAAIGPYAQALRVGNLIYTAGQGGLDPATGKLVEGDVEAQAEQAMRNLAAVLAAADSSFEQVVKTNIYLRYIKDFEAVNEVYARFFEGQYPARSTIAAAALPMGALVEIEMIAEFDEEELEKPKETEEIEAVLEPKTKKKQKAKKKPSSKKSAKPKKKNQADKGKKKGKK